MSRILTVAESEFLTLVRSKAFIIGIFMMPALMFVFFMFMEYAQRHADREDRRFVVIDSTGVLYDVLAREAEAFNREAGDGDARTGPHFLPSRLDLNGESPDDVKVALSNRMRQKELFAVVEIPAGILAVRRRPARRIRQAVSRRGRRHAALRPPAGRCALDAGVPWRDRPAACARQPRDESRQQHGTVRRPRPRRRRYRPNRSPCSEGSGAAGRARAALPEGGARLRAIPGPQETRFASVALERLFSAPHRHHAVEPHGLPARAGTAGTPRPDNYLSDATPLGSLQVPRSGQPILLMADRQPGGFTEDCDGDCGRRRRWPVNWRPATGFASCRARARTRSTRCNRLERRLAGQAP